MILETGPHWSEGIDPRIIELMETYQKALGKISLAQDPKIRQVLREEAINILDQATVVQTAINLIKQLGTRNFP